MTQLFAATRKWQKIFLLLREGRPPFARPDMVRVSLCIIIVIAALRRKMTCSAECREKGAVLVQLWKVSGTAADGCVEGRRQSRGAVASRRVCSGRIPRKTRAAWRELCSQRKKKVFLFFS